VNLNGTGIAPVASLNPSPALIFGNQLVITTSIQQSVTLTNSGTEVLKLASVAIDPASTNASDFAIVPGAATTCTAGATIGFTAPNNSCTVAVTFTPAAAGMRGPATLKFTDNSGEVTGSVQSITLSGTGQTPPSALRFVPVTPCRLVDTRNTPNGQFEGPALSGGGTRNFTIPQSANCNIPSTAAAYSLNVAVIPNGPLGYVTLWPAGQTQPLVATLSSIDGRVRSNAAIVPAGPGGTISVYASNATDLVMDINGYFTTAAPGAYAFYPVTPCRLVDTRNSNGSLGGPALPGNTSRTFPLPAGSCNLPSTAQAYSLNLAVVPQGPLGYITAWPTGQTQPGTANLSSVTGTVTASAAIVPAGTSGSINVYTSNTTDLIIDVNGYFAVPGAGGLSLYNLSPCRILDTRTGNGQPFTGELDDTVTASTCGVPGGAQAYVLNATVVPPSALGYLTLWPQGTTQPIVATLSALDATVTSNQAIVPTSNGSIATFAANPTQLILDIFGFFAP
jgi:hypothetical protein